MYTQMKPDSGVYADRNDPVAVSFEDDKLVITTRDGRVIHTPLHWFDWLCKATPEQRQDYEIMGSSIYWKQLDEGLSMEVILLGRYGT